MTAWGSRLPISLEPLIAEAKRRMRRRRLLVAAMALVLVGSAFGAAFTLGRPNSTQGPALGSSPAHAQPPLSNLATRMALCGNRYDTCHSPDGKWSIVFVNRSPGPVSYSYSNGKVTGYNPPRVGCTLMVTQLTTGRKEQIHLKVSECDHSLWVGHRYVFQDPGLAPGARVLSVDLPSRHVTVLARVGNDVVSPNGRWIAGETQLRPYSCQSAANCHPGRWLVAVVSPTTGTCRVVTEGKVLGPAAILAGGPTQDVAVDRSPWEFPRILTSKPFKDPVVWRKVVEGGTKIQIVSGPGTGFTRDSQSLIVAKWHFRTHPLKKIGPIHKRLLKFDLSSLHTPCPASVAASGSR
jgi:hypothetical protein